MHLVLHHAAQATRARFLAMSQARLGTVDTERYEAAMAASVVVMAGDHVDHTRPLGRARPPFLAAQHEALGLPLRYGRDTGWGGGGMGVGLEPAQASVTAKEPRIRPRASAGR